MPIRLFRPFLRAPAGTMDDWGSYTPEQKLAKIQECLDYEMKKKEQEKAPIVVEGTPEEFVQIIDDRYKEIQGMEGFGEFRMSEASIA